MSVLVSLAVPIVRKLIMRSETAATCMQVIGVLSNIHASIQDDIKAKLASRKTQDDEDAMTLPAPALVRTSKRIPFFARKNKEIV